MKLREIAHRDMHNQRSSELTYLDRYFFRIIGTMIAYIILRYTKITANQVTLGSILISIVGGALLYSNLTLCSFLTFLIFPVLDCADGTVARCRASTAKNPYGVVVDALGGYTFMVIFWISLFLYLEAHTDENFAFMCVIILVINLWSRLYLNKKKSVENSNGDMMTKNVRRSKLYFIYENLEFGSAQIPLFGISLISGGLYLFCLFYLFIAFSMFGWVCRDVINECSG